MTLTESIRRYNLAKSELVAAEKDLNLLVERSSRLRKGIPSLIDLIDRLPKGYPGTRQLYEKLSHLEEEDAIANPGKSRVKPDSVEEMIKFHGSLEAAILSKNDTIKRRAGYGKRSPLAAAELVMLTSERDKRLSKKKGKS